MAIERRGGNDGVLVMEDAQIIFRNFAGKEGMYNSEGDRNFCVILDPETADKMVADGWNVKTLKPRDEGDEPTPYIQVSVKYRGRDGNLVRPPTIAMITSRGRLNLTEDECEVLDWVNIAVADLIIRPYHWSVRENSGIKAYLQSLFITIEEDYLQQKYADVELANPESAPVLELEDPNIIDAEVVENQ